MKMLYDNDRQKIVLYVNNPKTTPGKYTVIFSPNNWSEWVRFPLIVCVVDEPRYLFKPDDYSMKFRPDSQSRRFDIPDWPVLGGSETYPCGQCEVRIKYDDERLFGGWFYYSSTKKYIHVNPEHDTSPVITETGQQKIPLTYQVVYSHKNKETVIHEENEEIILTYSKKNWKKLLDKAKKKKKELEKLQE